MLFNVFHIVVVNCEEPFSQGSLTLVKLHWVNVKFATEPVIDAWGSATFWQLANIERDAYVGARHRLFLSLSRSKGNIL